MSDDVSYQKFERTRVPLDTSVCTIIHANDQKQSNPRMNYTKYKIIFLLE